MLDTHTHTIYTRTDTHTHTHNIQYSLLFTVKIMTQTRPRCCAYWCIVSLVYSRARHSRMWVVSVTWLRLHLLKNLLLYVMNRKRIGPLRRSRICRRKMPLFPFRKINPDSCVVQPTSSQYNDWANPSFRLNTDNTGIQCLLCREHKMYLLHRNKLLILYIKK
jgi:hypothetical protein